mmetsp:Transcript_15821/g.20080  ORF Transcript_15821/g.20080 Transcript_15821/m.20080 type:complete len:174 (+) Transcript_15821:83-604(+)
MKSIQDQQEAFATKGQNSPDNKPKTPITRNLAAERMAAIKQQQEAFSKKGQKSPEKPLPKATRGNFAAEKMAAIKAQQEAFANKGKKTEESQEEDTSGIKGVASKFGDTVKPKSAVQRRKEAFERQQKEAAMKNDPKAYQSVTWKNGEGFGKFKKKVTDSRGIAPKKSLADLP